jgi:hypothetical protein
LDLGAISSLAMMVLLAAVMLAAAPLTYYVFRNRKYRLLIAVAVWAVVLGFVLFVPSMYSWGGTLCGPGVGANGTVGCDNYTYYNSPSYTYLCMGAQLTVIRHSDNSITLGSYAPLAFCQFS